MELAKSLTRSKAESKRILPGRIIAPVAPDQYNRAERDAIETEQKQHGREHPAEQ
jgi:hypothetical protein